MIRSWRFVLSGNNLTDEQYPVAGTSSLTTASGYSEIIYARPLSAGAQRNVQFLGSTRSVRRAERARDPARGVFDQAPRLLDRRGQ